MLHRHKIRRIIRPWIVIPADYIQILCHGKLIQLLYVAGHIGLDGDFRIVPFEHFIFVPEAFRCGVGDKTHVVQLDGRIEAVVVVQLRGRGHFFKAGENSSPEGGMPSFIQFLHRAIASSQPYPEFGLACGAIAVGSVFIGYMPHRQGRVAGITLCHFFRNRRGPLPVFQAVDAEKHSHAVGAFPACDIHRQHLRISG